MASLDAHDPAATVGLWFRALHAHLAKLMAARPKLNQKIIVLVPDSVPAYLAAPLAGLLRTVALEHPKMSGALVRIAGPCDIDRAHGRSPLPKRRRLTRSSRSATKATARASHGVRFRSRLLQPSRSRCNSILMASTGSPAGSAAWVSSSREDLIARGARRIVLSGRRQTPDASSSSAARRTSRPGRRHSLHAL